MMFEVKCKADLGNLSKYPPLVRVFRAPREQHAHTIYIKLMCKLIMEPEDKEAYCLLIKIPCIIAD